MKTKHPGKLRLCLLDRFITFVMLKTSSTRTAWLVPRQSPLIKNKTRVGTIEIWSCERPRTHFAFGQLAHRTQNGTAHFWREDYAWMPPVGEHRGISLPTKKSYLHHRLNWAFVGCVIAVIFVNRFTDLQYSFTVFSYPPLPTLFLTHGFCLVFFL